ncbi:MAG: putative permease [Paracoccaceae bacterium]
MNLTLTVIEIVAPVFLLAGIGFVWVKLGLEYRNQFVTRMAMNLAMPCLIFVSLMQTTIEPSALATLSFATIAVYATVAVASALFVRVTGLNRRTYLAPFLIGNTGNLGLPLALFAFGETGLGYAVVVFAISTIWAFTYGIYLISGHSSLLRVLREPLVISSLLGALFLWQGWETPQVVTNTLSLIGQMAIPMMLITLGVAVARLKPGGIGRAVWVALAKLVLCFVTAWLVAGLFDLNSVAFGVLVLQISTPVAVSSYLMAEKYGADSEAVAALVMVSTLMSVAALPVILALLL